MPISLRFYYKPFIAAGMPVTLENYLSRDELYRQSSHASQIKVLNMIYIL
jgi:hypothetical protein